MQGRHSVLSISIVLALGLTLPISPRLLAQSALFSARAEDSPVIPTSEKPALSTPSLEKSEEKKSPEKCKTGIYIVSLYDLNPNDSTFSSDFWIWFNHKLPDADMIKSVELKNAKEYTKLVTDTGTIKDIIWSTEKVKAKLFHEWSIANFPFDSHRLKIIIEEGLKDSDELIFEPDKENSKVSKEVNLDGWKITGFEIEKTTVEYDSTFGDPEGKDGSTYTGLVATISITRDAMSLFYKLHIGVYIAFLITVLAFFMETSSEDIFSGRIGLIVAMLFASILNAQSAESTVGQSLDMTLIDKIHSTTYCYIFIAILLTLLSRYLSSQEKDVLAKRLNITAFVLFVSTYCGINYWLIASAASSVAK